ncbi:MAG: gamma-glutamylcyclotransferase [Proteobacteria bacterium]|nr:gamma-glutamylcyclotransferase [Pseudomonadota bacterium]
MSNNVFAYGTLMLPKVVEALTGNLFTPKAAILNGYSRYVFKDKCYPGIIEDKTGSVEGVLYVNIDDRTLSIFDWLEDTIYERHLLTVQIKDEKLQAFTYVVPEKHQHKLDNTAWTLEKFISDDAEIYIQKCIGYRKQWEREVNRS